MNFPKPKGARADMVRQEDDFSELAVCAVRYALGRMTYVSHSVPRAIINNIDLMTTNALTVIVRDITEHKERYGKIGMSVDEDSWMRFKDTIERIVEERKKIGAREAIRKQN